MPLRALIVLLLAMNLGVALWWALRPAPDPPPAPGLPADVARLQLVSEAAPGALQAAALNTANANVQADGPLAETGEQAGAALEDPHCFSLGPWPDSGQAEAARTALQPQAVRLRQRQAAAVGAGWRVMLPPLASREQARATVARLLEAGFDDHFIIGSGAEVNAIALGRFSVEARARSHAAALSEAGFDAVAEPLEAAGAPIWIDLAAEAGFDPEAARAATGARQADPIDCARLQ